MGAHGVETQPILIGKEATYNSIRALLGTDAVAMVEFEAQGEREWHASQAHVGSASLQTEVHGKRSGAWSGKWYAAPNGIGIEPDGGELLRAACTQMATELTVVDYTLGVPGTTLTVTDENGNAVVFTESATPGADEFDAVTSNDQTATNIAVAINASTSFAGTVTAAAVGAVVTITSNTSKVVVTSSPATAWTPTKVSYKFNLSNPHTLNAVKCVSDELYTRVMGMWVEQIERDYNDPIPLWSASGGFADLGGLRGTPYTDNAGYAGGVAVVNLRADSAYQIRRGAVVKFGTEDNGGTGYTVTGVDDSPSAASQTGKVVTFTPVLANAIAGAETAITPVFPTPTTGGEIESAVECGLTVDGTDLDFNAYKVTLATGIHPRDKLRNQDTPQGVSLGQRSVVGEAEFYFENASAGLGFGDAVQGVTRSITARAGPDIAGEREKIVTGKVRGAESQIQTPEFDETLNVYGFTARKNAANEDEFRIDYD